MTMSIAPRTRGTEAAPSSAHGPIPFTRLVRVEWAKATDTRAARWLLALVALSTAGIMLAPILAPTSFDQTYTSYLQRRRRRAGDPPACGGGPDVHR